MRNCPCGRCAPSPGATRSESVPRGAGCPNWARPDLWEPRGSNPPGPPGRLFLPILAGALFALSPACRAREAAPPASAEQRALDAFWQRLLAALESPESASLTQLVTTTAPRCQPPEKLFGPLPGSDERRGRLAALWRQKSPLWPTRFDDEIEVSLGPPMPSMTTLCLRRVQGEWRLAGWIPGG